MSAERGTPYYQTNFTAEEFTARRNRVIERIGPDSVAVLQGAAATGAFDMFRQSNEFFYFCGVEVPHAYLLLDGKTNKSILYLPPCDERNERADGPSLSLEDAEQAIRCTGVDEVRPREQLSKDLRTAITVYTPSAPSERRQACQDTLRHARTLIEQDPYDKSKSREAVFQRKLSAFHSAADHADLTPLINEMRGIKSSSEIEMMRKTGLLTAMAVNESMRCTQAGLYEYQLAAVAEFVFNVNGSNGGGYRPIVATGDNIWNAHYFRNNCKLEDGNLVLMDYAPDYGCYTNDIGRFWPVNGTYSDLQRQLYGFIIEYHKAFLEILRPGVTVKQINDEARAKMTPVVEQTKWLDPAFETAARECLAFEHHLTHPVGMAVHDVGPRTTDDYVFEPGFVFALDPQMWVKDQQIYIRVEDTVVITEDGVENLTEAAPLELDDVEKLMQEAGVTSLRPDLLLV
ncbi:MAG: aminopeptidase P N-terminal domain-containing protein [Pirellulales bacterium]